MGEWGRPGMMRMVMSPRWKVHVRRTIEVRHVSSGSVMVFARRSTRGESGGRGRGCMRVMMSYETVYHSRIGVIESTAMVMSRGGRRKHSRRIVRRIPGMRRS